MPSVHSGVVFRSQGEPVLNLESPPGVVPEAQRGELDTLAKLNGLRYGQVRDPEITSRIAAYELAYRMQSAAPELIDRVTMPFRHMENQDHLQRVKPLKHDIGQTETGLGLPLARLLVELHGGKLEIISAPGGCGSVQPSIRATRGATYA
jgi:hypothetical protein